MYAYNKAHDRIHLWNSLRDIYSTITTPWIVMGDINMFLSSKVKIGGIPRSVDKIKEFRDCVFDCGLMDL